MNIEEQIKVLENVIKQTNYSINQVKTRLNKMEQILKDNEKKLSYLYMQNNKLMKMRNLPNTSHITNKPSSTTTSK